MEYPKTENLYASNGAQDSTRRSGPEFGFRAPGVGQISNWLVTEKVDGMNMRVVWTPGGEHYEPEPEVAILGRTDRAQIPGDLLALMQETFTDEAMVEAFRTEDDQLPERVVLFGEGFGPGIQQGGHYGLTKQFALFDVVVNDWWLQWSDVKDIARKLGVPTVPVLEENASLVDIEDIIRHTGDPLFGWLTETPEGVIARTDPYLFDQRGHRIMFKYKVRDL